MRLLNAIKQVVSYFVVIGYLLMDTLIIKILVDLFPST